MREQKLHILLNFGKKMETQKGLKVLENALHVSAHEKPALALTLASSKIWHVRKERALVNLAQKILTLNIQGF
jgi:hypothetical protein